MYMRGISNFLQRKTDFAERSKILAGFRSKKVILLNYQNNYVVTGLSKFFAAFPHYF